MKALTAVRAVMMGVALLGAVAAAPAQGPDQGGGPGFGAHRPPMERMLGPHGPHGRWWNDQTVIDRLKLTDDQRKDMDNILLQHREKLIDLRGNLEKTELAMDPLVNADQPNESAILAQIDKVAQARAELEKANARFLLALRAKLTPDQWKQLQSIRGEHGDGMRHRDWRQRGPGEGPGGPGGPGTPGGPAGSPGAPGSAGPEPQALLEP